MSEDTIQFLKYLFCGGLSAGVDILVFYALAWSLLPSMTPTDPVVKLFVAVAAFIEDHFKKGTAWLCRLLRIVPKHVDELLRGRFYVIGKCVSFVFSNTVAFVTNMLWVFEKSDKALHEQVAVFFTISGISVGIGTFLGWLLIKRFHLPTTVSYVTTAVATLLINYQARKMFVFVPPEVTDAVVALF